MKKTKGIYHLSVWALLGCVILQPLQPPPVFASTSVKLPHTEKSSAALSAGIVEAEYSGLKTMPTVFILQDAHGQSSAQKSLVNVLAEISRSYSIKTAFVEGGSGKMETLILRSAPDRKLLETILKPLQEKGELSGAVSQAVLGERPLDYEGVEDAAVYEAQIISYLQGLKFKDKALSKIKNLKNLMTEEKKRNYSKSAFELDQKIEEADTDFSKIPGFLSDQTRNQALTGYPFLAALALEFQERQNPITFAEAEEIKKRFELLEKHIQDKESLRELGERKQAYTTGQVDGVEAGLYLTRASKEPFSSTLEAKIKRRSLLNQMHSSAFLLEWKRYTGTVLTQTLETAEARTLHEKDRVLKLLEKCLKFELTSQEWQELNGARGEAEKLSGEAGLSAEPAELKPFFSFYEIAVRRDEIFKNKILSAVKGAKSEENFIFLAGGFHTEGMCEALRANGISFKVIRPEMKEVEAGETYRSLMQGKCSWLKPGEWSQKKNLHDSFIYWAAEEMADLKNGLLKEWRDQILRTLAEREELSKAGEYTKILDEVAIKRSSLKENEQTAAVWKIRAEKFLTDLQGLISSGQLNEKNLAKLFAAPAASAPVEKPLFGTVFSEAFFGVLAGDFPADKVEAIPRLAPARSEIRILENYEGFTEFKPLVKSALELLNQEWLYTREELKSLGTVVVDETSELPSGEIEEGKIRLSQKFVQALTQNPSGARILARFLTRLLNENAAKRQGAENESVKTIGLRQDLLRFLEETEAEREAALAFVISSEERGFYLAAHEAMKSKEQAIEQMKPWQKLSESNEARRNIVERVTQSVTTEEMRIREQKIERAHLKAQAEAYKTEGYYNGASSPEYFWRRAPLELMRELLMELTREVQNNRQEDARELIAKKYGVKSEELNQPISFSLHPWQLFLNDLRETGLSETSPKLIGLYDYLTRNVSEVPESLSRHTDRDKKIGLLMEFMNWNQPARIFDWSEDFTEEERNSALTKLMEFLAGDISDPDEKCGHRWNPQTMTFEETEPAAIADLPEENLLTSHWLLTQGKNLFASRYGFLGESTLRFTTGDLTQKSTEFYKNVQIASITRALQLFLGNPVFEMLQRREGESDYELAKRFTETQVKNPESGKAFAEAVSRDLVLSRNIIFIDDLRRRASSGFLKTNLEEIYAFQNLLKRMLPTLEEIEIERKRPLSTYQSELSPEEALKKFGVLGAEILAEKQKMQGEKIPYARKADGQPAIFYENGKPVLAVLANAGKKVTGVIVYTTGENGEVLYEDHYLISSAQEIFSEEKDLAYWKAARAPALSSRILYQDGKPALRFVLDPESQTIKGLESLENPLTEKTQTGESYAVSFQARQKELVSPDYPFDAAKTNVSDWQNLEVEVKAAPEKEEKEELAAKEYTRENGLIKFIRVHSRGKGKEKQPVALELIRFPKGETLGDFYGISTDKETVEKMKAKEFWTKADEIQKEKDLEPLTKRVFYDNENFDKNEKLPYRDILELSLEEGMVTGIRSHGYSADGTKTHTDTHQYQNEAGEDDFAVFDKKAALPDWLKTPIRRREFLDSEGNTILSIESDPKDSGKIISITHLKEIEKIVKGKKTRERVEIHFSGETLEAALQNKFHSEWTLEDWLGVLAPYELAVKGSGKDESFEKVREELLKKFENRRKLLDLALSYYISLQHQSEIEVEESWVTQVEDFVQNVLRQSLRPWIADIDERPRDLARVLRRTAVLLEDYKKELGIPPASITGQIREFLPEMLGSRLWDEKDLLTALASVRSKESETEEPEVSGGNFFNAVGKMLGVHEDQVSTIAAVHEKILKRAGVNLSQYHGNFNELLETSAAMQAAFWAVQYIQKQYPTDSPFGEFESAVEDDGISLVYRSTRELGKPLAQTQIDVQSDAGSNRIVRWDNARKNAAAQWNSERVERSLAEMAEEPEQQKKQDLVLEIYTLNGLHGSSSREAVSEKLYAGNKALKDGGLLVVMLPANKGFSEEGIEQMAEHYGYERVEEGISYNEFSAEYRAQTAKGGETADAELEKEDLIQNQKFYVLILKKQKDISEAREFLPKNHLAVKTFPLVSSDAGGSYVKTVAPDGTIHLIPRLNIQDLIKKEGFKKLVPAKPETRVGRKIKAGGFRHRKPKHKEMDRRDFQYAQQQLRRIQKYRGLLFEHFKKDTTGRTRFRQLLNRTHSPQMENDRTDKFAEKWNESVDSWFTDDKEPDTGKWPISKTIFSEDGTRAVSLSYAPSSRSVVQVVIHEVGENGILLSAEPRKVLKETVYDKNWNYEQLVKLEGTLYAAELDLPSLMNRRRNVYLPIFENHSLLIKEVYPVLGIYSDFETWFSDDVWRSLKAVADEDLAGHPLEAVLAPIAQEQEFLKAIEKVFNDASRAITEDEAKKIWTLRFMMKRLLRSRKFVAAKRWGKRAPRDGKPQNGEIEKIEANIISQTLRSNVSFVGASAIAKVIQSNRQAKSGERFAVLDGGSGTGAVAHALSAVGLTPQDDSGFIFHERDPSQESLDQVRPSGFQGERYKKEKKNMGELQDDAAEFYDQVSLSYIVHLLTPEQARDMYTGLNRIVKTGGEVTQAIPQSWRFTKAYLEGLRQLGWEMVEAPRRIGERASEEWIQSIKEKYGNTPEGDAIAEQVRQIKSRQFTLLRLRKISAVDTQEALKIAAEDFELEKTETGQTGKGTGERKFDFGPEALKKWLEVESWTLKDWSENEITADDPVNGTVSREEILKEIFPEIESEDALKHLHDLRFLFSSRQGEGNPYETISDFFIYWNSGIQQFHRKTVEQLARYYREGSPALRRGPPQKLKLSRVLARLSSRARKFERLNRGFEENSPAYRRNRAVVQEIENLKAKIQEQFSELQNVKDEWSVDFAIPKDLKERFKFAADWKTLKAGGSSQAEWTPRSLAGLQWFVTKIQKPGDELIAALLRNPPSIPSQKGLETVPSSPAGKLPSAGLIKEETQPAAAPEAQLQTVEEKRKINYEAPEVQRQIYWIHLQMLEELLTQGLPKDSPREIAAYREDFYRNGKIPALQVFNRLLASGKGQALLGGDFSAEDLQTSDWQKTFELIHARRTLLEAARAFFAARQSPWIKELNLASFDGSAGDSEDQVRLVDGLLKVPESDSELVAPGLVLTGKEHSPKAAVFYFVADPFLEMAAPEYFSRLDSQTSIIVMTPGFEKEKTAAIFQGEGRVKIISSTERYQAMKGKAGTRLKRGVLDMTEIPTSEDLDEVNRAAEQKIEDALLLCQTNDAEGMKKSAADLLIDTQLYRMGHGVTDLVAAKAGGAKSFSEMVPNWSQKKMNEFIGGLKQLSGDPEEIASKVKEFSISSLVNSLHQELIERGYQIDKKEITRLARLNLGRNEGFAVQSSNLLPVPLPRQVLLDPWSYKIPEKISAPPKTPKVEEKRKINYEDPEVQRQMYWVHSQILEELLKNGLSKDKTPQIFAYRKDFYRNGKIPDVDIFNSFLSGAKGQALLAGKFSPEDLRTPEWKETFELVYTRRALLEALRAWFSSRQNNLAHIQDLKQMKLSGEAGDYVLVNDGLMKAPNSESELLYPNLFLSKAGRKPKSAFLYLVPDPFLRSRPAEYLKRLDPEMPLTVVTPDSEVGNVKDMFRGVTAVNVVGVDQRAREVSERFQRLYKEEDVEAVRKITGIRSTPEEGVKEDEKAAKNLAEILTLLQTENRDAMTVKTAVLQRQAVAYKIGDALTGFHLSKLVGQNSGGLQDKWLTQIYSKFNSLSRLADSESGGEGFDDMAKLFTLEHLVNSFYSYALKEGYKIDKSELESVWKMHLGRNEGFAMQTQKAKPVLLPNNAVLDPWSYELPLKPTELEARSEVRTEEEETEMALRLWNTNWRVMLENAKENPEAAANIENAAIYLARAFRFISEKNLLRDSRNVEVSMESVLEDLERLAGSGFRSRLIEAEDNDFKIPQDPVLAANYLAEKKLWWLTSEDIQFANEKVERLFEAPDRPSKEAVVEDIKSWTDLESPGNRGLQVKARQIALMMAFDRKFAAREESSLTPEEREVFALFMNVPAAALDIKIAEAQVLYDGAQDAKVDFSRRVILEGAAEAALEPELLKILNRRIDEISDKSVVKALGGFIFPKTQDNQRGEIAKLLALFMDEKKKGNEKKAAEQLRRMSEPELRVFLSITPINLKRRDLSESQKIIAAEEIIRALMKEVNSRSLEKKTAALFALMGMVTEDPLIRHSVFTEPLEAAFFDLLKSSEGRAAFRAFLKKRPAAGVSLGAFLFYADFSSNSQGKIVKQGGASLLSELGQTLLDELRKSLIEEDTLYFTSLERIIANYLGNAAAHSLETAAAERFSGKISEIVFKSALRNPKIGLLAFSRFAGGWVGFSRRDARNLIHRYGRMIAAGDLGGISPKDAERQVRNWLIQHTDFKEGEDYQSLSDAFEKGLRSRELKQGFQEPSAPEKETIKKLVQNILYAESDSVRAAAQGEYEEFVEKDLAFISKEESIMRKIYARIAVLSEPVRLDFPYESYKKGMAFFHLERPWVTEKLNSNEKVKLIRTITEYFQDVSRLPVERNGYHRVFSEVYNAPGIIDLLKEYGLTVEGESFFGVPKQLKEDTDLNWPDFSSAAEMMKYFNSLTALSLRNKLLNNSVKFIQDFNSLIQLPEERKAFFDAVERFRNLTEPLRYWFHSADPFVLTHQNLRAVKQLIEEMGSTKSPWLNSIAISFLQDIYGSRFSSQERDQEMLSHFSLSLGSTGFTDAQPKLFVLFSTPAEKGNIKQSLLGLELSYKLHLKRRQTKETPFSPTAEQLTELSVLLAARAQVSEAELREELEVEPGKPITENRFKRLAEQFQNDQKKSEQSASDLSVEIPEELNPRNFSGSAFDVAFQMARENARRKLWVLSQKDKTQIDQQVKAIYAASESEQEELFKKMMENNVRSPNRYQDWSRRIYTYLAVLRESHFGRYEYSKQKAIERLAGSLREEMPNSGFYSQKAFEGIEEAQLAAEAAQDPRLENWQKIVLRDRAHRLWEGIVVQQEDADKITDLRRDLRSTSSSLNTMPAATSILQAWIDHVISGENPESLEVRRGRLALAIRASEESEMLPQIIPAMSDLEEFMDYAVLSQASPVLKASSRKVLARLEENLVDADFKRNFIEKMKRMDSGVFGAWLADSSLLEPKDLDLLSQTYPRLYEAIQTGFSSSDPETAQSFSELIQNYVREYYFRSVSAHGDESNFLLAQGQKAAGIWADLLGAVTAKPEFFEGNLSKLFLAESIAITTAHNVPIWAQIAERVAQNLQTAVPALLADSARRGGGINPNELQAKLENFFTALAVWGGANEAQTRQILGVAESAAFTDNRFRLVLDEMRKEMPAPERKSEAVVYTGELAALNQANWSITDGEKQQIEQLIGALFHPSLNDLQLHDKQSQLWGYINEPKNIYQSWSRRILANAVYQKKSAVSPVDSARLTALLHFAAEHLGTLVEGFYRDRAWTANVSEDRVILGIKFLQVYEQAAEDSKLDYGTRTILTYDASMFFTDLKAKFATVETLLSKAPDESALATFKPLSFKPGDYPEGAAEAILLSAASSAAFNQMSGLEKKRILNEIDNKLNSFTRRESFRRFLFSNYSRAAILFKLLNGAHFFGNYYELLLKEGLQSGDPHLSYYVMQAISAYLRNALETDPARARKMALDFFVTLQNRTKAIEQTSNLIPLLFGALFGGRLKLPDMLDFWKEAIERMIDEKKQGQSIEWPLAEDIRRFINNKGVFYEVNQALIDSVLAEKMPRIEELLRSAEQFEAQTPAAVPAPEKKSETVIYTGELEELNRANWSITESERQEIEKLAEGLFEPGLSDEELESRQNNLRQYLWKPENIYQVWSRFILVYPVVREKLLTLSVPYKRLREIERFADLNLIISWKTLSKSLWTDIRTAESKALDGLKLLQIYTQASEDKRLSLGVRGHLQDFAHMIFIQLQNSPEWSSAVRYFEQIPENSSLESYRPIENRGSGVRMNLEQGVEGILLDFAAYAKQAEVDVHLRVRIVNKLEAKLASPEEVTAFKKFLFRLPLAIETLRHLFKEINYKGPNYERAVLGFISEEDPAMILRGAQAFNRYLEILKIVNPGRAREIAVEALTVLLNRPDALRNTNPFIVTILMASAPIGMPEIQRPGYTIDFVADALEKMAEKKRAGESVVFPSRQDLEKYLAGMSSFFVMSEEQYEAFKKQKWPRLEQLLRSAEQSAAQVPAAVSASTPAQGEDPWVQQVLKDLDRPMWKVTGEEIAAIDQKVDALFDDSLTLQQLQEKQNDLMSYINAPEDPLENLSLKALAKVVLGKVSQKRLVSPSRLKVIMDFADKDLGFLWSEKIQGTPIVKLVVGLRILKILLEGAKDERQSFSIRIQLLFLAIQNYKTIINSSSVGREAGLVFIKIDSASVLSFFSYPEVEPKPFSASRSIVSAREGLESLLSDFSQIRRLPSADKTKFLNSLNQTLKDPDEKNGLKPLLADRYLALFLLTSLLSEQSFESDNFFQLAKEMMSDENPSVVFTGTWLLFSLLEVPQVSKNRKNVQAAAVGGMNALFNRENAFEKIPPVLSFFVVNALSDKTRLGLSQELIKNLELVLKELVRRKSLGEQVYLPNFPQVESYLRHNSVTGSLPGSEANRLLNESLPIFKKLLEPGGESQGPEGEGSVRSEIRLSVEEAAEISTASLFDGQIPLRPVRSSVVKNLRELGFEPFARAFRAAAFSRSGLPSVKAPSWLDPKLEKPVNDLRQLAQTSQGQEAAYLSEWTSEAPDQESVIGFLRANRDAHLLVTWLDSSLTKPGAVLAGDTIRAAQAQAKWLERKVAEVVGPGRFQLRVPSSYRQAAAFAGSSVQALAKLSGKKDGEVRRLGVSIYGPDLAELFEKTGWSETSGFSKSMSHDVLENDEAYLPKQYLVLVSGAKLSQQIEDPLQQQVVEGRGDRYQFHSRNIPKEMLTSLIQTFVQIQNHFARSA